jgi:ferredoxin-NADP reductase
VPPVRKLRCAVESIQNHGNQVYTLRLEPENEVPQFHPGQFLHLAIDKYDPSRYWPDSRAFSIASSPTNRRNITISYSVKGQFTGRMERELKVGDEVWIKLPYGEFVIADRPDVVLIAGGTGITAFTAFLEALPIDRLQEVFLFYGARSENLLIHRNLLSRLADQHPHFHLVYALETPSFKNFPERCSLYSGQLAVDWILSQIHEEQNKSYYLSGPPAMLHRFSQDLCSHHIQADKIHMDAWD